MGLIYAGVDLFDEWGIFVDSSQTWEKPTRDREFIHVPGRNGDLILDRGSWNNVEIVYNAHIDNNFSSTFEDFVEWVSFQRGYAMLVDDKHPGVYRMAAIETEFDVDTTFTTNTADFEIVFNCKPQQYINDGVDRTITLDFTTDDDGASIVGGDKWHGAPVLTIFGATSGARIEISAGAGTYEIIVAPFTEDRIVIDFETGNAVFEDGVGDYVGMANPYLTVIPPSVYVPDFPDAYESYSIIAYHTDPDDSSEYTGTLEYDPQFYRI